jgi:hypothetical protein
MSRYLFIQKSPYIELPYYSNGNLGFVKKKLDKALTCDIIMISFCFKEVSPMEEKTLVTEEKLPRPISGMAMLILGILLLAGSIVLFVLGVIGLSRAEALGIPAPTATW